MQKINFYSEKTYDYLFALLILVLPYSMAIPNLIIGILILLFVFGIKKEFFIDYFKSPFFILSLLVFYIFFQAIINDSFFLDIGFYKKYFYLLIIPVLFLKVKKIQLLKILSIGIINITIFISFFKIAKFYYYFKFLPFADGWATNSVLALERPYAGIFSLISIIFSLEQFILQKKSKIRYLFLLSLLLSIFFIFFISIRISIISFLIISILYGFFYVKVNLKTKVIVLISITTLFFTTIVLNPNIAKRFFVQNNIESTITKFKESEPRIIIWNCAYQITQQEDFSILTGTNSYTNIKNSMVSCYETSIEDYSRNQWFMSRKYNTHNQYLDFYLIGGVLALFSLLVFFFTFLIKNKNNFYAIAIFTSFFVMMIVENVFHRQFGCLIFTIFTSLVLNNKKENV